MLVTELLENIILDLDFGKHLHTQFIEYFAGSVNTDIYAYSHILLVHIQHSTVNVTHLAKQIRRLQEI
jgi:hypothetical protein